MNYNNLISQIVAAQYPFTKTCISHRQRILGLRISRADRIKREMEGMSEDEQAEYLKTLENEIHSK